MKNIKSNKSNMNLYGRNRKYELRYKKNEANKNANEEESESISNDLSDSSLSCSSLYMIREETNKEKNEDVTKRMNLKNKYKNKNMISGLDNKATNHIYSKQSYIYDHYKKKDILLSLWWKSIIDLYSDILITNLCSNVSNIEILNMNNIKKNYQYLNEGIILFHNSKKSNNYKMSILRIITKEEINKKNEDNFFYSSAIKNNIIDDSFKKYYSKKYKHIPIIKRYNCMNIPYYATNSSIFYCNKEMNKYETKFIHDGNAIIANKSIDGQIYIYSIKKTIERINKIENNEEEETENEEAHKKDEDDDDNKRENDINKNFLNNDFCYEKEVKNKKVKTSENYKKKLEQRKICDGKLLLELLGHNKTGKGLFFKNNYLLSNGDDKNIFIYDINSTPIFSNKNKYGDNHVNIGKINPLISIKTNEIYSNVRWLYDSLIIGSTYSGYFSLFDIRMKNNQINNFNNLYNNNSSKSGNNSSNNNVKIYSMHKKISKYEISDIDKYNNEDNNLICLSSLNNIFIFDLRFINNNLPYKIIHDNSYNNFSINDSHLEPYQTSLQTGEYNNNTDVNYFYDHSYNNFYNEDFFNSDTFIHSLFWCNIEAFNYIGSLNNKGIINLFDINKSKHHCVFTYGCKYIKLFKFNPFKINNFVSVDKNNILILFTLPDQIYKSDLDLYLKDNFEAE